MEYTAGGLVYRKNQGSIDVLLIKDRFGKVSLPKGHLEGTETTEEAALREIKEETGITGNIVGSPLGIIQYDFTNSVGEAGQKQVIYFLVEAVTDLVNVQVEEIVDVLWLPIEEAAIFHDQHGYDNNVSIVQAGLDRLYQQQIEAVRRTIASEIGPIVVEAGFFAPRNPEQLASSIDHTLLKPEATKEMIDVLCEEAVTYSFATVCVNPVYVSQAAKSLKDSSVGVCTVIGFPLGASTTAIKIAETQDAISNGATEIDMVLAIGLLTSGDMQAVYHDIRSVVQIAKRSSADVQVKAIIETSLLTMNEKITSSLLALAAGADFVKTSTGFSGGGATIEDIRLMRMAVGPKMGVKASGGVRTREDALKLLEAGATRIGASASVAIVKGQMGTEGY